MKKLNQFFLVLLASLFIVSCSSNDKELISMLPKETAVVVGINVSSFIEKAGITIEGNKVVFPKEINDILNKNAIGDSVIKVLTSSGVDYKAKAYCFYVANNSNNLGVLLKINDTKALTELLTTYKLQDKIVTEGNLSHVKIEKFMAMWSDKALLLLGNEKNIDSDLIAVAKNIFDEKKAVFEPSKDVTSYLAKDNDYVGYINTAEVVKALGNMSAQYKALNLEKICSGVLFCGDYNKNDVTTKIEFILDKESAPYKLGEKIAGKPSDSFLKLMPNNVDGVYSVALNGAELMKTEEMKKIIESIPLSSYGLTVADVTKMIGDINGTISISASNVDKMSAASVYLSIESKDPKFMVERINGIVSKMGLPSSKTGNDYVYSMGGMTASIGDKDGFFNLTFNGQPITETAYSNSVLKGLYSSAMSGLYISFEKDGSITKLYNKNAGSSYSIMPGYYTIAINKDSSIESKYVLTDNKYKNSLEAFLVQACQAYKATEETQVELDRMF